MANVGENETSLNNQAVYRDQENQTHQDGFHVIMEHLERIEMCMLALNYT